MKKNTLKNNTFVVSSEVLLYDTDALFKFKNNDIVIPANVIQELGYLSKQNTEKGYFAREVLKTLYGAVDSKDKNLKEGVTIGDSLVKISYDLSSDTVKGVSDSNFKKIIACTLNVEGTLVTKDKLLTLFAKDFVPVEEYFADKIKTKEIYKGYREESVNPEVITNLYENQKIENSFNLNPNEFIVLKSKINNNHQAVGICKNNQIIPCDFNNMFKKAGIFTQTKPINLEQKMFMYLLLDEDIKLISCSGVSGKGKSLLSIDFALEAINKQKFNNVLYTKSSIAVDKEEELGFYKGHLNEKLKPHLRPLYDSIEFLFQKEIYESKNNINSSDDKVEQLLEGNIVNFYPLANIRGMSVFKKVVILDEAQNITNHMMKSLVTRINDNSKLIVIGDVEQIDDRKHLNKFNNGLSHLIEQSKSIDFIGHITMDIAPQSKRGKLSSFGANML